MNSKIPNADPVWVLAIHGGASPVQQDEDHRVEAFIKDILQKGGKDLEGGKSAVSVVADVVKQLEASGLFSAGKGAGANDKGEWELDAGIMDGETRRAGAVAALQGYKNPISVAKSVLQHSSHVMLVGEGAAKFARNQNQRKINSPKSYFTPKPVKRSFDGQLAFGTVGACALDVDGLLASAASSGGSQGSAPGSVGVSGVIGAGVWADERVAVSCTGLGEYFVRTSAASNVSARMKFGRQSVQQAAEAAIEDISYLGGEGGMVAIDCLGRVAMPFNTPGMKRGLIHSGGKVRVYLSE